MTLFQRRLPGQQHQQPLPRRRNLLNLPRPPRRPLQLRHLMDPRRRESEVGRRRFSRQRRKRRERLRPMRPRNQGVVHPRNPRLPLPRPNQRPNQGPPKPRKLLHQLRRLVAPVTTHECMHDSIAASLRANSFLRRYHAYSIYWSNAHSVIVQSNPSS
ncbi:uncharacterized protein EI90DRAFT_3050857 [Cantharellus anzutake]|uniref:uncharacterized protein n=1 Tax=Cantharellus anzutake TaxID=1750568 RepID=UPI001906654A|nr:uncharacterized protein EI90DRAFT_3050857 [Cantharellus anzutake]KAF8334060.1 hypothetical protein EI90DRAFT_3050857 [Cantharellus anzutake]